LILPHKGGGKVVADDLEYTLQAFPHVVVPEADDHVAFAVQERCAGAVIGAALIVLAAIHLDDQPGAVRAEIDRVIDAEWHLPAPVRIRISVAECAPEGSFFGRHVAAKPAGARDCVGREGQAAQPLPPCGGGVGGAHEPVRLANRILLSRRRGSPPTNLPHKGGG
jgi:hypothetical protein